MNFYQQSVEQVVQQLKTNIENGLTQDEVIERQSRDGLNEFAKKKHTSLLQKFIAQFKSFMIIVLLVAAVVSFMVSMLQGEVDWVDPIIIFAIIFLNAILGVIQEYKAEKSLSALKQLSAPDAKVIRDKKSPSRIRSSFRLSHVLYL